MRELNLPYDDEQTMLSPSDVRASKAAKDRRSKGGARDGASRRVHARRIGELSLRRPRLALERTRVSRRVGCPAARSLESSPMQEQAATANEW
jgi:hypothetical protein